MIPRSARNALLAAVGLLVLGAGLASSAAGPSRKELLAALPEEDRKWLTEFVAPIILPEEEKLFLELTDPHLRERFQREFWERRERQGLPPPLGPGYEGRYRELRSRADEIYDGWTSDAGQMVIRWGEPARIRATQDCQYVFRDLEIWTYASGPLGGSPSEIGFYRPHMGVPRRLLDRQTRESDIFLPTSCRQTFISLWLDCPESSVAEKLADKCRGPVCSDACTVFHLYQGVLGASGAFQERSSLFAPARISLEGIDKIKSMSATASDPNAKPLTVAGPSATVPSTPPARVSKKSKKELLADLPAEEREWLTSFVAPIILKEEENLFLELTESYQREIFKKEFWDRRERDGLGPPFGEGFKRRYEELRPLLDSAYDGWRNDAAQLVLHFGEPADINHVEGCDAVFRDVEIWTYTNLGNTRGRTRHLLYRTQPLAPRKLWRETTNRIQRKEQVQPSSNPSTYDEIFSPGSCRKQLDDLRLDCQPALGDNCKGPVCPGACEVYQVYQEELARQGDYMGAIGERARLFKLPEISTEGLDRLRERLSTIADPNAKSLSVQGPSSTPRAAVEPTPTPEPLHALTAEEVRDRIVHLEPKYRQFLDLAGPLLTEDALQRFLQMTPKDRDRFMKEFWKRRS